MSVWRKLSREAPSSKRDVLQGAMCDFSFFQIVSRYLISRDALRAWMESSIPFVMEVLLLCPLVK